MPDLVSDDREPPLQSTGPHAIQIEDLTVAYRDKPVLWDIDLTVPQGVLMAVVGPNGAGKTTLLKAILGLVRPVAGSVLILGRPYGEQRKKIGYAVSYTHLRAHETPEH